MVSVLFMLVVGFAEPFFAGQLGIIQLASVAITYPLVSLSGMIGAGAVGGGVVSALSRSIGKNDLDRANVVIWHSFIIYCVVSIIFFIVFVFFSRNLFIAPKPPTFKISTKISFLRANILNRMGYFPNNIEININIPAIP